MSKVIVDQQARDKIKSDLTKNFLVEAGAGSGKTTSLVERMVNLIHSGLGKINEIVAITFTRKAADELKLRFQSQLEKKWKTEKDEILKLRLGDALQNMEQCFLGTVHAFCAKLLRDRPVEANLDLSFKELEQQEDDEILEEAWQVYLQILQDESKVKLDKIVELGLNLDVLYTVLKDELRNYPDVEWVTTTVAKPNIIPTFQELKTLLLDAKRALPNSEPEKGYDPLQKAILDGLRKMRFMEEIQDKDIIELFELFDKKLKPTLNRWGSKEDAKFYEQKITSFYDLKISPLLLEWRQYCHPFIISFLKGAIVEYERLKKERSLLNFQDLLIKTKELLRDNALVRSFFQKKYRYLLVDEFQDTDPIQAEIMFYLSSENHEEKVWTSCKPRPGSLFVVGDPKQAIYRFRRADIDTYNRVKELIEQHGGETLQLTMNFRTVDTVTEKLNGVFIQHLPKKETTYQAAYRALKAFKKGNKNGLKKLSISSEFSKKDDIVKQDAYQIASYIKQGLDNGNNSKDYMVLTRYNDGIAIYAEALEELGIPVSVSGERIIGETKEFQELLILLKTFVDPTDSVAFTATLRGIFFGISDEELYQWKTAKANFTIYSKVPESLNENTRYKFELTLSKLRMYQKWLRNYSPTVTIEKILEDVGFYQLLILKKDGKRAQRSLLQILDSVRQQEVQGKTSFHTIYHSIKEKIMKKTIVVNIEEEVDAVRVMNVHKAKGLEAPIVFLAHPKKKTNPEKKLSRHIKREDTGSKGIFAILNKTQNYPKILSLPVDWDNYKQEELQYLMEEETRILYVAATRAEKELIISSSLKSDKDNPWIELIQGTELELIELEVEDSTTTYQEQKLLKYQEYMNSTVDLKVWIESSKERSYETYSPSTDKDYGLVLDLNRGAGGGKEWGSLIHAVLEKLVQGKDVSNYILNLLDQYNFSSKREQEVWEYINHFQQSSVWTELLNVDKILTEVPFSFKVEVNDELYTYITDNGSKPYIVKGVIDLIYKRNDEWVMVDYKTDRVKNKEDLVRLQNFYEGQVYFYKKAWERLTGEKVGDCKLYFFEFMKDIVADS